MLWEKYYWKKSGGIGVVSSDDQKVIEKNLGKKVEIIPNGVDCDYFNEVTKREPKSPTILFVGSFKWLQNRDAAKYLVYELWPGIKKAISGNVKLRIVGNSADKSLQKNDPQVSIDDNVSDIRKAYNYSTILLAPIRLGGGTKFKILESMAAGLPVVTTPKGIEGLGADSNGILVAQNADDLVAKTVHLLNNALVRREISRKEKKFVRQNFDWKDIAVKLDRIYLNLQ